MADQIGAIPVLSLTLIQQSIMRARLSANDNRKVEAAKRLDYYKGNQLHHLDAILNGQFAHPSRLKLQKQFSNIVRPIIDQVSMLYKRPPLRKLMRAGAEVDGPIADLYGDLQRNANMDAVMRTVNRYTNLLQTVAVMAVWRNERVELDILTPDILNVVQDPKDPTKAAAVIIEQAYGDSVALDDQANPYGVRKLYIVWTPQDHAVFNEQGTFMSELSNEERVNPYGLIPAAFFRDDLALGEFWGEGGDELVNAQEAINVKLTELNQLIKLQSFSIPVFVGDAPPEGITVDPSNFISIPLGDATGRGQPDFKFVSPDPKIGDLLGVIKEEVSRIAISYGISPEQFRLSGSPASGFALQVLNQRIDDKRENDAAIYRDAERDLFNAMRAVWNAHNPPARAIPEDVELTVDFTENEAPQDPAAEDARWLVRINNGIKSRADWLMAVDPDIKTKDEAIARLAENDAINAKTRRASDVSGMAKALGIGAEPESEAEDEQEGGAE